MAVNATINLPVKTGGTGALSTGPQPVDTLDGMELQTTGSFSATVQLQGSLDGSTWVQIGSNITGAGVVAVSGNYQYLRMNTSAYTSGTPVCTLAGRSRKPNEVKVLEFKTTVAAGAAIDVSGLTSLEIQIKGTGTYSVDVQGSLDGTNFIKIGSSVTSAGFVAVSQECNYIRLNTTDATSPASTGAWICGKPRVANVTRSLKAAASATNGPTVDVEDLMTITVQATVVDSTLQLQGSLDGATWYQIGTDFAASAFATVSGTHNYLRANTSAYGTDTPVMAVIGREFNRNGVARVDSE